MKKFILSFFFITLISFGFHELASAQQNDSFNSITWTTLKNAKITLPKEYRPSSFGIMGHIGEVQSFSLHNKTQNAPNFTLELYYPSSDLPGDYESVLEGTFFDNSNRVDQFVTAYTKEFDSRVLSPKTDWGTPVVLTQGQDPYLKIPATFQGEQGYHDQYVWVSTHGFFILMVTYREPTAANNDLIQKVVHSFQLP